MHARCGWQRTWQQVDVLRCQAPASHTGGEQHPAPEHRQQAGQGCRAPVTGAHGGTWGHTPTMQTLSHCQLFRCPGGCSSPALKCDQKTVCAGCSGPVQHEHSVCECASRQVAENLHWWSKASAPSARAPLFPSPLLYLLLLSFRVSFLSATVYLCSAAGGLAVTPPPYWHLQALQLAVVFSLLFEFLVLFSGSILGL
jgi:hypothetical protein